MRLVGGGAVRDVPTGCDPLGSCSVVLARGFRLGFPFVLAARQARLLTSLPTHARNHSWGHAL